MLNKDEIINITIELEKLFPNAHCELNYHNPFELLIAVSLSAQTTDINVNKVTPTLFNKYPTAYELALARTEDVKEIIKSIGLANHKSNNIIELSKILVKDYQGQVPDDFDILITLPGVGRKTANVVLAEGFNQNHIGVDTHVERVSKRLGLANQDDSVLQVEQKLMNQLPIDNWHHYHHLLIFFGRYLCKAKNPLCDQCFYQSKCKAPH